MADVFISYRRSDRARIEPIAKILASYGYTVWWDLELVAGQRWAKRIKIELDAARCVVVVWTAESVGPDKAYTTEWVENEADEGARRGILVPVLLDKGYVAWTHQKVQFASLIGWSGEDPLHPGITELLNGVVRCAGERENPSAAEMQAWSHVADAESAEGVRTFIAEFPTSRFVGLARERLAEIEEQAAWNDLGDDPGRDAVIAFLQTFPNGRYSDEAKALLWRIDAPRREAAARRRAKYLKVGVMIAGGVLILSGILSIPYLAVNWFVIFPAATLTQRGSREGVRVALVDTATLRGGRCASQVAFSADDRWLMSIHDAYSSRVEIRPTNDISAPPRALFVPQSTSYPMEFSRDTSETVVVGGGGPYRFDIETLSFEPSENSRPVAISTRASIEREAAGCFLFSCSSSLVVRNRNDGSVRFRIVAGELRVSALALSPNGRYIVVARGEKSCFFACSLTGSSLEVLDAESGRSLSKVDDTGFFGALTFLADGRLLAWDAEPKMSVGVNSPLTVWDIEPLARTAVLSNHALQRDDVFLDPARDLIFAVERERVSVWSAADLTLLGTVRGHLGNVSAVLSHDGQMLATSGIDDCRLRLWRISRS